MVLIYLLYCRNTTMQYIGKSNYMSIFNIIRLGWLYTEPHIGIWVVGKQGRVFQYEADRDDFKMVYKLPDTSEAISCGYLDRNDNIWICRKDTVLLYRSIQNSAFFI